MTKRLYFEDPYCTRFSARVVEQLTWDGHPAVVLDRTAFYPTSGGQPADRGTLEDTEVLDVVERAEDRAIIHVLSEKPSGLERPQRSEVEGVVDWGRRFDHMQQHTGQHILSAAFERVLDGETVGFHLGTEASTIDVDLGGLEPEDVRPVEELANQVVWADRPVKTHFIDSDQLASLPVSRPLKVGGPMRIVEIASGPPARSRPPSSDQETQGSGRAATEPSFDVNACGGTHVARTGEIGLIKIVNLEHRGDETRVEFLCGHRAMRDYREKDAMTRRLASMLTVGYWELDQVVERMQDEVKQLRRDRRQARQRLLEMEADQLAAGAVTHGPYDVVQRVWHEREASELNALARKLAEHPNVVALLFSVGDRTHFCFARAEELDLNVEQLLQEACRSLDGKGGGRPQVAQGSAPPTDRSRVEALVSDLLSAHT